MDALTDESGRLVIELHTTLSDIDPARWNAGAADSMRGKLRAIQARAAELMAARWPANGGRLRDGLSDLERQLSIEIPDEEATAATSAQRWMAFKNSMAPSYEALRASLGALEIHVPSLRPTNYKRNVLHVFSALLSMSILWVVSEWWAIGIACSVCVAAWTAELLRRRSTWVNSKIMAVLHPVAHPHEFRRVNSATWYCTALAILSLTREPLTAAIGLAVLGFGDPAAALIGRRFGRTKLVHGRTLEGTVAFFVAASLGAFAVAFAFDPSIAWTTALLFALAGALTGAVAELFSLRIDDNLSVALAGACGAMLVSYAM